MSSHSRIELAVDMRSPCCAGKVEKAVGEMAGIKSIKVDLARQSVIVEGDVIAENLKGVIEKKTGMSAVVMGLGSMSHQNLGSATAAIDIGDSSVKGLLRMTQTNPDFCIIEGSIDGLPDSENLFVYLHDTGDISNGCYSCGPPSGHDSERSDCIGLISHLKPEREGSAQFRCSSSKLKVHEMYGRCVVVHSGDKNKIRESQSSRLACGIVARSSGLFQNSKRFCACDGVTIWEEKKKTDEQVAQ